MSEAKHILAVKIGPATVRCACSCGKKISYARGCNRGGKDYALAGGWEIYAKHCRKLGVIPMIPAECKGLAGVELTTAEAEGRP